MTTTAFLRLRNALADHLLAGNVADGRVRRGRSRPIAATEASAVNLRLLDSQYSRAVIQTNDWRTTLQIECMARPLPGGDDSDTAADALLSAVYTRLHSFSSADLGLMGVDDECTVAWEQDNQDGPYTCATLSLTVWHRTPAQSLEPSA